MNRVYEFEIWHGKQPTPGVLINCFNFGFSNLIKQGRPPKKSELATTSACYDECKFVIALYDFYSTFLLLPIVVFPSLRKVRSPGVPANVGLATHSLTHLICHFQTSTLAHCDTHTHILPLLDFQTSTLQGSTLSL